MGGVRENFGNRLLLLFPHPQFFCWRVILFLTITLGFFQILEISFICSKHQFLYLLSYFSAITAINVTYRTEKDAEKPQARSYSTLHDEILTCIWADDFMSNSCVANFFILLCSNHSSFIGFNIKLDQSSGGNIKVVILVWNPSSLFDLHRQRKNINFRIVTGTHNSSLHLIFSPTGGTVSFPWGEEYFLIWSL